MLLGGDAVFEVAAPTAAAALLLLLGIMPGFVLPAVVLLMFLVAVAAAGCCGALSCLRPVILLLSALIALPKPMPDGFCCFCFCDCCDAAGVLLPVLPVLLKLGRAGPAAVLCALGGVWQLLAGLYRAAPKPAAAVGVRILYAGLAVGVTTPEYADSDAVSSQSPSVLITSWKDFRPSTADCLSSFADAVAARGGGT
jgi:hypothetical protein